MSHLWVGHYSPGEKIFFVGPLRKTKKGNIAVLTLVDVYTRWFHAWPVKNQTADTVIKVLVQDYAPAHLVFEIFCKYEYFIKV